MVEMTVFTATYNRKDKLRRAFESLQAQTCKDFEWLIIDDGSTDGTGDIILELKKIADFEIRYFWKENGGRHTAVNYSYKYLRTTYVITLDSDDELVPNAVEKAINIWHSLPSHIYDKVWCVSGREVDIYGNMVGMPYPSGINELNRKEKRKQFLKCEGEKHCCRKVSVLIQYPFPVYPDTKFVSENTVWEKINKEYDQYFVNEIFGIYHEDSSDSLSKRTHHYKSFYYAGLFYVNEMFDELLINRTTRKYIINVSRCALLTGVKYNTVMSSVNKWYKKGLVTLGYPISGLWVLFHLDRRVKQ